MLKRLVVAAPVGWNGPSLGREILCELDGFLAQLHAHDAHTHAEEAFQFFILGAVHFAIADFFKAQYLAEEFCLAFNIRNGHADGLDGFDELRESRASKN